MLQPYSNNCEWGIMDTAIVNQINPIIEEVATRKGVEIIDLHSQFNTPEWFLADSVHPNATGAKELARIIKEGILKVPEVSDSTGTGDSTMAIRGNARGFVGLDAHNFGEQDMRRFDVQGRKLNVKPKRFTPAIRQVKKR